MVVVSAELLGLRRQLPAQCRTLGSIKDAIRHSYKLSSELEFVIQWVDEDGDTITVSSDDEWIEALSSAGDRELALIVQAGAGVTAEHIQQLENDAEWVIVDEEGNSRPSSVANSVANSVSHSETSAATITAEPQSAAVPAMAAPPAAAPQPSPEELAARLEAQELENRRMQEEMDRKAAEELARQMEEEDKLNAARAKQEAEERERMAKEEEAQRIAADERRREEERQREIEAKIEQERAEEAARQEAAKQEAEAAAAAAAAARVVPAAAGDLQIDAGTWTLLYQLQEMGFGDDFKKLHDVMKAHNMDLGATAEALAAEAMV